MRSKSDTASWVSLRSPSTFLFIFSTSPFDFFSLSRASSHSSRDCSSFPFTLDRWLHLSSMAWMSSSVFWRPSPAPFFSFWSLEISSSWWAISSLRVLIWLSLVILSSSFFSQSDSRFLISSLRRLASEVTLTPAWLMLLMRSSSPLTRLLTSSSCFWTSFLAASILLVLSMMSWTMDPPEVRAMFSSCFSATRRSWTLTTASHSAMALSMLASARAILSSYSFLYFPNWVHLRLGLMASQICIHNQVLAIIMVLMALWQEYRAIFWSCSFLKAILEALPLAPDCSQARTEPILSSRISSILPSCPARKKTLVCPSLNFSLSILTMSITAPAAALSFLALATAAAARML